VGHPSAVTGPQFLDRLRQCEAFAHLVEEDLSMRVCVSILGDEPGKVLGA
jgi:hypothetical protein